MVSQADVPPGEEAKIEVKVSTHGRTGLLSKTVRVLSNDPKTPTLNLTLKGTVMVEVGFANPNLRIPTLQIDEEKGAETKFMVKDRKDFKVLGIETSTPDLTAKLKPLEGETDEALVLMYKGKKVGPFNESVTIKTNRAGFETVRLQVSGMVKGDIEARPASVNFHQGSNKTEQAVALRSEKKPFKVIKAVDKNNMVKATFKKGATNQEWNLTVTLLYTGTDRANTEFADYHGLEDPTGNQASRVFPSGDTDTGQIETGLEAEEPPASRASRFCSPELADRTPSRSARLENELPALSSKTRRVHGPGVFRSWDQTYGHRKRWECRLLKKPCFWL